MAVSILDSAASAVAAADCSWAMSERISAVDCGQRANTAAADSVRPCTFVELQQGRLVRSFAP